MNTKHYFKWLVYGAYSHDTLLRWVVDFIDTGKLPAARVALRALEALAND